MHKLLVSLLLLFPLLAAAQDLQAPDNTLPASKPEQPVNHHDRSTGTVRTKNADRDTCTLFCRNNLQRAPLQAVVNRLREFSAKGKY